MKRQHVTESYFVDGGNTTKDAIIDYFFKKRPRYLCADAIDKLFPRDQTLLLNLMKTVKVSETKHRKIREVEIKTSVFATSNYTI
jgi:MoxR-like ATPase